MSDKQNTISKIYFDKSGFGSKKITFEDARKVDKTIKMTDIEDFSKKNIKQKKQLRGYNSFVATEANYEYQIDLMFLSDLTNQNFKVGMACIDIFSKYAVVVAIKSKQEGDVASGILECLNKMGKTPQIIYTDDEGALKTEAMQKYFKEQDITHIVTRSHAHFVERFIRTFKDALYKRIDNEKDKDNVQWNDYIFEVMLTYNNKLKHDSHGFTPAEASKRENSMDVKMNLEMKAKKNRKYPELNVNDEVKIYKKKERFEKERKSVWSENSYTIEQIKTSHNQKYYKLEGLAREYMRHELLKI